MPTRARNSHRPELTDVVAEIYEAALDPEQWTRALTHVNAFVQVASSALIMADAKSATNIVVTCGLDPRFVAEYAAHYSCLDPGIPVLNRGGPGCIALTNQIAPDREYAKTEFAEFLGRYDMFYCGGASLARSEGRDALFAMQRPKGAGGYGREDALGLRQLVPNLQRAFQISRTLSGLSAERDAALSMLDKIPHAIILLDALGRTVALNGRAEAIMRQGDGLSLTTTGIQVSNSDERRELGELVHRASETGRGRGTQSGGAVTVTRPSGAPAYRVLVVPVRMPQPRLDMGALRACAACIIASTGSASALQPEHLQTWFGLTPAEARVALAVTEGLSTKEIAERAGTSLETIRNQLKFVFSKVGVHRQAELTKVLLSSPAGMLGDPADDGTQEGRGRPRTQK